ncbi:unnamed protein product [Owenia fusiformis]|uniref:cAMP-dependent protein kinase type II regulatory subunit n=1 Tax=Owenia fusiformis TaxID=6347 RepID=A0A8J1TWL6_OWEFU|nr:unnamed protein product [Owenia fusiformis]
MNFEIPDGLGDMLRDFTVAVLRERPGDIHDFAVEYFTKTRDQRRPKSIPMYIIVSDDEDAGEPDPEKLKRKTDKNSFGRRHSVSAERYDPEADEGDDEKVVYPKSDSERKTLQDVCRSILIFKTLDSEQIADVIDAMFQKNVKPGDSIIRQGDDGDNFYVISEGTYDVFVKVEGNDKKVHTFDGKGSFGELALLYNMPRSATVNATSDGVLWAMDRKSFQRIVVKSAFKKRKMYEGLIENVPLLKNLNDYERMSLADALVSKSFSDGDTLMKEGDEADGMYFMEDGIVRITISKNGTETEVARQGRGKYIGELALIEDKPRSANVIAVGKVKAAFLDKDAFERILGNCLDIMKRTAQNSYKNN